MKAKIKVGIIHLEGTCFKCGKYSNLKFLGKDLLCLECAKKFQLP